MAPCSQNQVSGVPFNIVHKQNENKSQHFCVCMLDSPDDNYVMQLKVQQRFCLPQDQLFFYNTRSEMDVIIALHVAENGFHYKNGATPKYKGSLFRLACCIL